MRQKTIKAIERASAAIVGYKRCTNVNEKTLVPDLLIDLLHYAKFQGLDVDTTIANALTHFQAETRGKYVRIEPQQKTGAQKPYDFRTAEPAKEILERIRLVLSGRMWDADTPVEIADILTSNGFEIAEPNEADEDSE